MCISEFTKHWDRIHGFTREEAVEKKAKVDDAHGVWKPDAKWEPSQIVEDFERKDGYKVAIRKKGG